MVVSYDDSFYYLNNFFTEEVQVIK